MNSINDILRAVRTGEYVDGRYLVPVSTKLPAPDAVKTIIEHEVLAAVDATGYGDECRDDLRRRIRGAASALDLRYAYTDAREFVASYDEDWPEQDHFAS